MAKKKNTTTIFPFLFVVALAVGGGYYWGSRTNYESVSDVENDETGTIETSSVDEIDNEESQSEVNVDQESSPIENLENSDETTLHSDVKSLDKTVGSHRTTHTASKSNTFDAKHDDSQEPVKMNPIPGAEIDEFGNIIYTDKQPSKSSQTTTKSRSNTKQGKNQNTSIRYVTHYQGRWGYSYLCPTFLSKETRSQNDDGNSFEDGKGMKLTTYGGWNSLNESLSDLYRKDFPGIKSVTYKSLLRNQHAYVKSGYTTDNKVFYLKESIIKRGGQEVIVTLYLTYPKNCKWQMNKIINDMFGRFPLINQ